MTESEAEELETPVLTPEIVPQNQLALFIQEADIEPEMGSFLIEKYKDHFKLAAEWAKKAKSIIVTDESQTVNMQMAKTGRLFLRKQRLEIENTRKMLKAGALKECQCIDRLSNFLKDVIIPTEEHLDRQEHFVEYREKAKQDAIKLEVEARMERERIEKEKADAEALAKAQAENARLRKESEAKEKALAEERRKVAYEQEKIKKENEAKIAKERAEQQAKLDMVRKEQEAKLAQERIERQKAEYELLAKRQAEAKAEADRIYKEESLLKADDQTKMIAFRRSVEAIKIPEVKSAINKRIIEDSKSHLWLAISKINIINKEEE